MRLLGYVKPYLRAFVLAILAMALTAGAESLVPWMLKQLLDKGFTSAPFGGRLWLAPLVIILVFSARSLFGYLGTYLMTWVSNSVICDLRTAMFSRVVKLPTHYLHDTPSSRLITRMISDVNGVASASTSVITTLVRDTITVACLLVWLVYLDWVLTLLIALIVPPVVLTIRVFSRRLRDTNRGMQLANAAMTQSLQENFDGHKVVKIHGGESQEVSRFYAQNREMRRLNIREGMASAAIYPIVNFLVALVVGLIIYIALYRAAENGTTSGAFISYVTAMLMLLPPMKHLADVNSQLQRGVVAAESVFTLVDTPGEEDIGTADPVEIQGDICFTNVGFKYSGTDKVVLNDINLVIPAGKTFALVGPSGSGKTTIANLLPRFFSPTNGRILIDGLDIADFKLSALRRHIAFVSQDVILFDDTIAANIAYGLTRDAAAADIEAAARAAYAHDFIMAMPEGYQTRIGENGVRLSGGQRQRLAIARALLKNSRILILDEATSALDAESERQVQAALEQLMKNRTTLVIAHRLSTIESADQIIVMEHGRIAEQGDHASLLAKEGMYAKLYQLNALEDRAQ